MFSWNSLAFSMIQRMLAIWSLVPLPFLKPAWTSGSSQFTYCWSLAWRILSVTLLACVLGCNLKNNRMISVYFQGKPFNITVIQAYAPTSNTEEAEVEQFYEDPQDLLELTPKKRCPFHYGGLECKSRKSRNTWSNRQIWPWSTEWSRQKANRVVPRKRTGYSKHPLPTTQEKTLHMDITRWSTPKSHWLYSLQPRMEKLYIVSKNKTGSWLWLRSWTPYCQIQT